MTEKSIGAPVDVRVVRLSGGDSHHWLEPALEVYVTAMGYPHTIANQRKTLWRDHIARPGWSAFGAIAGIDAAGIDAAGIDAAAVHGARARNAGVAHAPHPRHLRRWWGAGGTADRDEALLGIAYGYRGAPDQWWNQQLRIGLRQAGCPVEHAARLLADYFELTELHVHPDAQGRGIGRALLSALLADRPESRVLLSTPEVPDEGNRAWSLYRRFGFGDVLRDFTFAGDPRPFAFLGRDLPIPPIGHY